MAKNINIHIKTPGAGQAKQNLDKVGRGAKGVGDKTKQMGQDAQQGSNKFMSALKGLTSALGIAAVIAMLVKAISKVNEFFDLLASRSDQAVTDLEGVRSKLQDIYEAAGAFSEASRQEVAKETYSLLEKTSVSEAVGLPIINAYKRQFGGLVESGQLTQEQYEEGLTGMLGYGERHGGAATADLIGIMKGWGMYTPEEQGAFRRTIATGAGKSGLTDAELIGAMSRGMPTIKAMGWSPGQTVETISILAAGEAGRKKASLPATTIQALGAPQAGNLEKYGISADLATKPQALFQQIQMMSQTMESEKYYRMLQEIYSLEGAAGVSKLITAPRGDIKQALLQAAGPGGLAAEAAEEADRMGTLEAKSAKTAAMINLLKTQVLSDEVAMKNVRMLGEQYQKILQRKEPLAQSVREKFSGKATEKEYAAFRLWEETLTPEERERFEAGWQESPGMISRHDYLFSRWGAFDPQRKYEELTDAPTINYIYHNDIINMPMVGTDPYMNRIESGVQP